MHNKYTHTKRNTKLYRLHPHPHRCVCTKIKSETEKIQERKNKHKNNNYDDNDTNRHKIQRNSNNAVSSFNQRKMKPFVAYFPELFTSLLFACCVFCVSEKKRNEINKWSGLKTNTAKRILFPFHFVLCGLDWIVELPFFGCCAADFGRVCNKQIFHFNEKNTKKIGTMCILHPP